MRAAMRVEMGILAKRFPHVSFAIGASAKTWEVEESYDFFANVARLGVVLAGRNVASGVHDRASIIDLLRGQLALRQGH
jgi:hypothetical protein